MTIRKRKRIFTSVALLALASIASAGGISYCPAGAVVAAQSEGAGGQPARLNFLTGTYRESVGRDTEIGRRAMAATAHLEGEERLRRGRALFRLLHAPPLFAVEQYGTTVTVNIPGAGRVPYEADGKPRVFRATGGETVTARARLSGRALSVDLTWSGGERLVMSYEVSADGNTLVFKRAVADASLLRPVEVVSEYRRVASKATRTFAGYDSQ